MDTNTKSVPALLGEPFAGGFYAGRVRNGDQTYAIIVAPKAEGEHDSAPWAKSTKRLEAAMSFNDGLANTEAMAAAGSKLAKWARGLTIGGFSDWYIPSRDELELCYRAFKPTTDENWCYRGDNPSSVPPGYAYFPELPAQTENEIFRKGGAEAFEREWYWSSTQYAGDADSAWIHGFFGGDQLDDRKDDVYRARAVRRVAI